MTVAARAASWPNIVLLALGAITFVVLIALGTWQVQRLGWKLDLIERVDTRRALPAVPAPGPAAWPTFDPVTMEYQPVRVRGQFDHSQELYLYFPLTEPLDPSGGPGVMVFTPFDTDDGWRVLVNRGFVPDAMKAPELRQAGQVDGPTEVTGLLRGFERRSALNPGPDFGTRLFFARDRRDMSEAMSSPNEALAPYYLDATAEMTPVGGLPQAGKTRIAFSNNHLQYAITWYGLAAALVGVMVAFLLRRPDARRSQAPQD